jgi:RNase P protein component
LTRLQLLPTQLPVDVVIRVRPEAYDAGFHHLRADVDRALAQLARLGQAPLEAAPPPAPGAP